MEIYDGLENLNRKLTKPVVTVGNFDGVHLGHNALFAKVIQRAAAIGGTSVVVTFDPHPVRVLSETGGPPLLTVRRRKEELIAAQRVDVLLVIQFTRDFARLTARDFVEKILIRKIGLAELVVGFDSTIGRGREGTVEFVEKMGRELGFTVHVVEPVMVGGQRVSSTRAREMIQAGRVAEVRALLGRCYQISGRVVPGHSRGGKVLGFPTANLRLFNEVVPAWGVYAVKVTLDDGRQVKGVTNVGVNPTFGDETLSVETFLLDFDQDLYDQFIRLDFVERLRDEMKFNGPDALAEQIAKDVARAREILG